MQYLRVICEPIAASIEGGSERERQKVYSGTSEQKPKGLKRSRHLEVIVPCPEKAKGPWLADCIPGGDAMPGMKYIEFCIPTAKKVVPAGPDWIHEVKYDGYRLRVERAGDRVRLLSKGGHDWTSRYPWIVETARKIRKTQFILDGEASAKIRIVPAPLFGVRSRKGPQPGRGGGSLSQGPWRRGVGRRAAANTRTVRSFRSARHEIAGKGLPRHPRHSPRPLRRKALRAAAIHYAKRT
jgi:hypothetical protein